MNLNAVKETMPSNRQEEPDVSSEHAQLEVTRQTTNQSLSSQKALALRV